MTERHAGYLVTLKKNLRDDDSELVINAIKMLKGVLDVTPVESSDMQTAIAEQRVRFELGEKLNTILFPERK